MIDVEAAARSVLGDRLTEVTWQELTNFDGQDVLRIRIIYDATQGISVEEMDRTLDALIEMTHPVGRPFPVIDFQADVEEAGVAAE